jgi:hypothetical protein
MSHDVLCFEIGMMLAGAKNLRSPTPVDTKRGVSIRGSSLTTLLPLLTLRDKKDE